MPNSPFHLLRICHFNAQSILNKLGELEHFLVSQNIRICSVNETWLTPSKSLTIPNYQIIRKDRPTIGGGVCLIIHNSINFQTIDTASSEEILAINIKSTLKNHHDLAIVSYYSAPKAPFLASLIYPILDKRLNVLIVGDLNAHHSLWNSPRCCKKGDEIASLIMEANLTLLNDDSPTYLPLHRPNYQAILDLAICSSNLSTCFQNFETSDLFRSDHVPLILDFKSNQLPTLATPFKTIQVTNWA